MNDSLLYLRFENRSNVRRLAGMLRELAQREGFPTSPAGSDYLNRLASACRLLITSLVQRKVEIGGASLCKAYSQDAAVRRQMDGSVTCADTQTYEQHRSAVLRTSPD